MPCASSPGARRTTSGQIDRQDAVVLAGKAQTGVSLIAARALGLVAVHKASETGATAANLLAYWRV